MVKFVDVRESIGVMLEGADADLDGDAQIKAAFIARRPPWNRTSRLVVDTVLCVLENTGLLSPFIFYSMEADLIPQYERIGEEESDSEMIRVRISEVVCRRAAHTMSELARAVTARWIWNRKEKLHSYGMRTVDMFEIAILFAKEQTVAYGGLANVYALIGAKEKAHDWARRGLAQLDKIKRSPGGQAIRHSKIFPPDVHEQEEKWLQSFLKAA
jgi:hypothetical protein